MALLDRITGRQRGYDPDQTTEERLTEQENLNQQERDNLPAYPHANEPQETVPEHAVERTMGHEVRPANPYNKFTRVERRGVPPRMMSCTVPDVTRCGAMMRKPAPPSMVDPFKGIASSSMKKQPKRELPAGMEVFPGKGMKKRGNGKRFIW